MGKGAREHQGVGVRLEARTDLREYDTRLRVLVILFFIPLLILLGRLAYLQIIQGQYYRQASIQNTVRRHTIPAYRGTIFDARGRVIAENRPSYDVYLSPDLFSQDPEALSLLQSRLALSEQAMQRIEQATTSGQRAELRVRRDITRDQVAELEADRLNLPGLRIQPTPHRHYPYHDLAVHILGYMGEVPSHQLQDLSRYGYREGDYIGFLGIEEAFEPILRGHDGIERYVVDVHGQVQTHEFAQTLLSGFQHVEPTPGRNVVLTIDMELQQILADAMRNYPTGAIVAVDPRDGSVLAMLSKPGYNPNAWTGRLSEEEFERYRNDENTPLFDRAIHAYFPGSTFKIVTAIAALEEGLIGPNDTLRCDGHYTYGNHRFGCSRQHGHGEIHLAEALQQSCNVFFYKLGERLGMERLAEYAVALGFGERPGSGLPNEAPGLVPTREWLEQNSPEGFQYGQVLNVSVGQGDTRVSPLQLTMAYAAIANGGTLFYPRLIDRITNAEGDILFQYPTRSRRELPFQQEYLGEIVVGLTAAVNAVGGTAYESRLDYLIVAGKTGTAQGTQVDHTADEEIPTRERTSAWFAGFAPAQDPQIVVVVFLEHGGSGGRDATPVGVEIIDRYFREILDYDTEIQAALARGNTRELEGLMRLNRPGSQSDSVRWSNWAEPYVFGHFPDRPINRLIRQWNNQR
ncbi:MAG: penicillin-binding protein 2 [Bradymonadales bacterium]|nr:penicillin-binding protein 2 [Bradymonadales bacterium]